jgi:membrane-bound lytic murein transglycosylase D
VRKNRLRFLHLLPALFCIFVTADVNAAPPVTPVLGVSSNPDAHIVDLTDMTPDVYITPLAVEELMRASRTKFVEGFRYIATGDFQNARMEFDAAVDLVLQSEYDVAFIPTLRDYFQELIDQIHYAESNYIYLPDYEDNEEVAEHFIEGYEHLDLTAITDNAAIREALASGLPRNNFDIPISINEMVIKSLDFWLNRGYGQFIEGIRRSGQYYQMIEKIFREEEIPLDLIYLAQVESHFKPLALSRARATGIWQFMERTGIHYGLKVTRDIDERSDPEKSTRAAARYLKDLYGMFNDWNLALAAYNWGEGKVRQLVNSTGLTDFWELANLRRRMPNETRNHIPLIQASIILARNPEKFGLSIEKDPPMEYALIPIAKPIELREAARVLNTTYEELKRLNPALKGLATPVNYPGFKLRVPPGDLAEIQKKLASLPPMQFRPPADFNGRHRIQSGETLSGIAARYRTTVKELMHMNNLSSNRIRAGDHLYVPSTDMPKLASGTRPAFDPPDGFNGQHQISPGETLSGIAERYRTSVKELMTANRLSSNRIRAGDFLYVPSGSGGTQRATLQN